MRASKNSSKFAGGIVTRSCARTAALLDATITEKPEGSGVARIVTDTFL